MGIQDYYTIVTTCFLVTLLIPFDFSVGKIPLHVRSLIAYDSYDTASKFAWIQQNATEHVNRLDGLLDDYELRFDWNWTLDSTDVLSVLYEYVHNEPKILMLFGPPFSGISALVNPVAAQYHLIQVTTSNSPAIGDLSRYPYTVQIFPDENENNYGRIGFINLMGWTRIAIIFEDVEYFRSNMEHLVLELEHYDIDVLTIEAVSDIHNLDQHVQSLLRHDARIWIIAAYRWTIVNLACTAYAYGLHGSKYVWVIPGWLQEGKKPWHEAEDLPCHRDQVAEVTDGSIYVHTIRMVDDIDNINFNGQKPDSKQREFLSSVIQEGPVIPNMMRHFYDGIFNIAMTLNASIQSLAHLEPPKQLQDFDFHDDDIGRIFHKHARHLEFTGLTGRMLINSTRDPGGMLLYMSQMIEFKLKLICYFDHTGKYVTWLNNGNFTWKANMTPTDGRTYVHQFQDTSGGIRLFSYILSSLGICLSFVFLSINIVYREHRSMKVSSPNLNILIVTGCVLLNMIVFLPELSTLHQNQSAMVAICYIQLSLLSVGISLSLGALFMKTYRIREIFRLLTNMSTSRNTTLTDAGLLLRVLAFVVIDISVIIAWMTFDDMEIGFVSFEPQLNITRPELEIYTVNEILYCTSTYQTYFGGGLYGIKAAQLVYGVLLAWQTRLVNISELNDSKYIAISVYTIAIISVIAAPSLYVSRFNVDISYLIMSISVVAANTVVLCLVFIPKIIIFVQTKGVDVKISSMPSFTAPSEKQLKDRLSSLCEEIKQKDNLLKSLQTDKARLNQSIGL